MKSDKWKSRMPDIIIGILIFCAGIVGIYYVRQAVRNILIMDYWRIAGRLIPDVMENSLTMADFFRSDWGQSNPLLYFLLAINIKHFGLNSLLSEYFAVAVMALSAVIVYIAFRDAVEEEGKNRYLKAAFFIPMLLCVFNYNQKEILSIQFAFVFMFRVMSYLLIFRCVDYWLRNMNKKSWGCFVFSCLFVICAICLWSQLYFPAMCGATLAAVLFDLVVHGKKNETKRVLRYVIWTICVFAGMLLYHSYVKGVVSGGSGIPVFIQSLLNGDVFYGCFVMLLAAILPDAVIVRMSRSVIVAAGGMILLLILVCLIIYIRRKLYEKTYFPLLLILYGGGSILVIEFGRLGKYGPDQLRSSRYVCETTLLYIGLIMILALCVYQSKAVQRYLACAVLAVLVCSLSYSNWKVLRSAPAQGVYKEQAIIRVREIAEGTEVSGEDVGLFQANSTSEIKKGIRYLKKFHLGIFAHDKYFYGISDSVGIEGDGWVLEENELMITTGMEGKVIAYIYYPYWKDYEGHNVTVYVDGTEYGQYPVRQDMEIELKLETEREYTISFKCDHEARMSPPDERKLYFILTEIIGM